MKRLISVILVLIIVLSAYSFAFAANLGNVTYSKNTSLKSKFNSYESLNLKAGVTLTTSMAGSEPQGIEMHGPLVLENGANITGKGIILMFRGSSYSGIDFWYQLKSGELKQFPDMDTAYEKYKNADDFVFEFSANNDGKWVLNTIFEGDPFEEPKPHGPGFEEPGDNTFTYSDMRAEGYWSYDALNYAVNNGLIDGINGKLQPSGLATRAVLAIAINRIFGAVEKADISNFTDVKPTDSFYEEMQKSVKMKIFSGDGNGHLYPTNTLTRQEAFMVFALALNLKSDNLDVLNRFADGNDIAVWAKPYLAALVENGYVAGNGVSLNPLGTITREELAKLLQNIFPVLVRVSDEYTFFEKGNVVVSRPDVVIKNATIDGDLILGDGILSGVTTLDNVTVNGRLITRGESDYSLKLLGNSQNISIVKIQ